MSADPEVLLPRELQLLTGPQSQARAEGPSDPLQLASRARFVLSAMQRRKLLVASIFLLTLGGAVAALRVLPRTYHVETRIMALKPSAMPAAVRQGGGGYNPDDAPTKSAFEVIHRRDNLVSLVKQTNLFSPDDSPRKATLRERLGLPPMGFLAPAPTQEDRLNSLVTALDRQLIVNTGDGTVTISLDWGDPQQAYKIVQAATQNFFEVRQLQEITAVDEMISLLQGRAAALHDTLLAEQEEIRKERTVATAGERTLLTQRAPLRTEASEDLAELRSTLQAKQRAVKDVEEFRRRRLADLQAQLDEKRGIYSDAYPSVVSLRQDIEALNAPSPQVTALEEDARKLAQAIAAREPKRDRQPGEVLQPATRARPQSALLTETDEQSERLHDARFKYERMVERINQAQLELDATRAAFKYRYAVIWPAQVPTSPIRPKPTLVLGAGFMLAIFLAAVVAALADLATGLLYDSWQLEDRLGLPVLGEIHWS